MPNGSPLLATPPPRKPSRRTLIGAGGILLTLILAGGGIAFWRATHSSTAIPANITEKTIFPVYRFTYLPPGFTLDQASYTVRDGVLIFQATNAKGENLAITEAAMPPKLDFTSFYDKNFTNTKNLQAQTPYTTIMGILKSNSRHVASIETPATWIIITSQHNINESETIQLAKGLRRQ